MNKAMESFFEGFIYGEKENLEIIERCNLWIVRILILFFFKIEIRLKLLKI